MAAPVAGCVAAVAGYVAADVGPEALRREVSGVRA